MTEKQDNLVKFYCVKCRSERTFPLVDVQREIKPKGPDILRGKCPVCAGKLVKFVKRQAL